MIQTMERDMERDRCSPMTPPPMREREMMLAHHQGLHSPPSPSQISPHRPHIYPGLFPGARGSPLGLHLAFDKTVYSSPPQASNKPENNQCRLIDYRGAKVAAFSVEERELICLPQAFDLFLKHLVGGLHTVYTKLKRLGITPVVCNVEQVRILRGLGAIQPGVNRCKLLAPKEFDVLYEDCTNSSARPGRPPKRAGLGPSPDHYESLKKSRTEGDFYPPVPGRLVDPKKSGLFPNGYHFPPYHLPFMSPLAHPAMMNLAMANHLGMRPDMIHARESLPADLSTRRPQDDNKGDSRKSEHHQHMSHDPEKPLNLGMQKHEDSRSDSHIPALPRHNGHSEIHLNGHYSQPPPLARQDESEYDDDLSDADDILETDDMETSNNSADEFPYKTTLEAHAKNLGMPLPHPVPGPDGQNNSAIETLLLNILGLLKVAIENTRLMDEQAKHEKSQLKQEMIKEKETRESMEKQLEDEQKHIALLTKKLKRERRTARRLQEQIENVGLRQQARPQPIHVSHSQPHDTNTHANDDDACLKQAQEDLKKLNEISSRMSPVEDRKSYSSEPEAKHVVPSEPSSTSEVHSAMESLIMSAQRLPSSCHGSVNGYLHSPLIKQAEAV